MLLSVNYHYVRQVYDQPFPGIHGVTPAALERQLRILGGAGEFVDAAAVRAAVRGTASLPDRSILVTFDDGLREQYEAALPVLDRLGIPAVFFVNTDPIVSRTVASVHKIHLLRAHVAPAAFMAMISAGARALGLDMPLGAPLEGAVRQYRYDSPQVARLKYLLNFGFEQRSRDAIIDRCFLEVFPAEEAAVSQELYLDPTQIGELARRGYLGTHGDEHLPLGLLSAEAVTAGVRRSLERLADWTGVTPFALSYPYGSMEACSNGAGDAAASAGIEFAFTMERAGNLDFERPLHLARFDSNDLPGGKNPLADIETLFETLPSARWFRETEASHAG